LSDLTIGDSVTSIGDDAFRECTSLTSVTIPDSVSTIGAWAFCDCESLTSMTIGSGVIYIAPYAFSGCSGLTDVYYKGTMMQWKAISVVNIEWGEQYYVLEYGTIHPMVLSATSAKIKTLPTKMTYWLGEELNTAGLSLNVIDQDGYEVIVIDGFTVTGFDSRTPGTKTLTVSYKGFTFQYDVTVLFGGTCGENATWRMEDGVLTVSGTGAMESDLSAPWSDYADQITKVVIENGITNICESAFFDCINLTSITIPETVTEIGISAFDGCSSLTEITIPVSVTAIGDYAFFLCDSLTDVYFAGTKAQWNEITVGDGNEALTGAKLHTRLTADPIALKSVNIQLGSSMSLNLNGLASVLDQYENVYVIYEAPGKQPVKVTKYFLSGEGTDLRYNFAYEGLTILDLNLDVTYTIYGTFDGTEYHSEPKSISMLYYCNAMIANQHPQAAVPCANLLKYAIAAEAFMAESEGVSTDKHLVNVMTAAQKTAMEKYAYADSAVNVAKTSQVSNGTKIRFTSQSLDMVSRITLIYSMKLRDTNLDTSKVTFKVTYTDVDGKPAEKLYTFSDLVYDSENDVYMLNFSEFYATQMRQLAKCTIYIDGVEHGYYANSIENYCYTALNSASETNALKYLAKRISLYGDACYNTYG
jgi:hypothetical protein